MPTRAQSMEALERQILAGGAAEGASAPLGGTRGRQFRTFEDDPVPDTSRVERRTAREMLADGPNSAPAISVIDVGTGVVDTRWGPVLLQEGDRAAVARLIIAAVRRTWEAELSLLAGEALTPAPTGPVRKDGKPYKKRASRKKGEPSGESRSTDQ